MNDEPTFEAPGPGAWKTDPAHFQHGMSRWMQGVYPEAFAEGWLRTSEHYGLIISKITMKCVNDIPYVRMTPTGAPESATAPPPAPVLWLLGRLHPEMRRRRRRVEQVFEQKLWRQDLKRWDEEWKPELQGKWKALADVDVDALDDGELVRHLDACRDAVREATVMHHRLNGVWLLPLGDYLVQSQAWTGKSRDELLAPLAGASPVSMGAKAELEAARAALAGSPEANAILDGNEEPGERLEALRSRGDEVGEAVQAWLHIVGRRNIGGYDVADPRAIDDPGLLLETLRQPRSRKDGDGGVAVAREKLAALRAAVPAGKEAAFDALFEEARQVYRVREERCYLNDAWVYGITHDAIREAGRRLTERGRLDEPGHAFDLDPDELTRALKGGDAPGPETIRERHTRRIAARTDEAPPLLGADDDTPPDFSLLPGAAARAAMAIGAMIQECLEDATHAAPLAERPIGADATVLRGVSAYPGEYAGRACRVQGAQDLHRVTEGDVLVAPITTPAYNFVLPLLGGIVTDRGGLLSHAAIVAREFGIPSVVGCRHATASIDSGARVTVDGNTGTVRTEAAG